MTSIGYELKLFDVLEHYYLASYYRRVQKMPTCSRSFSFRVTQIDCVEIYAINLSVPVEMFSGAVCPRYYYLMYAGFVIDGYGINQRDWSFYRDFRQFK